MKSLFYGIGVATLVGLSCGAALRPTLALDRIGGPQIAIGDSGRVAYGDFDSAGPVNSYPYGVPDYVVGTDHLYRPAAYEPIDDTPVVETAWRDAPPASDQLPRADLPLVEPASYTPAPSHTYDAIVHYPSQGGGILAGLDEPPVDLGPEVIEPADAPAAQMAAFEADQALLAR